MSLSLSPSLSLPLSLSTIIGEPSSHTASLLQEAK